MKRIIGTAVAIGALASTAEAQDDRRTFTFEEVRGAVPSLLPPAGPQAGGPFQIAPQANMGNVWVINTRTGALRLCLPAGPDQVPRTAQCLPWGDMKR